MQKLVSPKDIVQSGLCIGCGSCVGHPGNSSSTMVFDKYGELKPTGSSSWYQQKSGVFTRTCPFSPAAKNEDEIGTWLFAGAAQKKSTLGYFETAYVGHVAEEDFREQGSSGGMVTWVANELLRNGLVDGVAHVVSTDPATNEGKFFKYTISTSEASLKAGAKSKYYPIELSEIITHIKAVPGRYAIIGIPCFIKAIHLLRKEDLVLRDRIQFTLGLFCGHMKSARFVESIALQMEIPIAEVSKVEFRYKDTGRPANWYSAMLTLKNNETVQKDWWHLADGDWGAGYFMNSACNYCDDVVAETADVSFGDAWLEPYTSDGRGTNVVVVRSQPVKQIIEDGVSSGRLKLETVTGDLVAQSQAAGFRQRREGLAYRLSWNKTGLKPVKRVLPSAAIAKERKRLYRMRFFISAWSHRVFSIARQTKQSSWYLAWARITAAIYHGLAYHKADIGEMKTRFKQLKKSSK